MNLSSLLENERRARLAAERLLELRQRELKAANLKLSQHARLLTSEILDQRGEVDDIRSRTEEMQTEYVQTREDLHRAKAAADTAETRLWSALQSVRDGFAMFDADRRLLTANKSYLSIFDGLECMAPGISYAQVVDLLIDEGIVDPQGPPDAWRATFAARWDEPDPQPAVLKLWNGQFIKLLDRRTPDGGMVTLGINETESLRTRAAIEAIPDGFVVFDQDDRLVMCNQRYRAVFPESAERIGNGTTFEDILRMGVAQGQYEDAIGREENWLEERLNAHRMGDFTIEQPLHDGRWLQIIERVTPDGGRVGLRVDITNLKVQQAALERERERAEAANRAKSNFLANMSHEIRTPMNGVIGMAEMLCEGPLNAEQRVCADTIRSSGRALLSIVNDILDFSKIEAGKMVVNAAPFDLESCLHGVARLLQPTVRNGSVPILIDLDRDFAPTVIGDEGRMRQVFMNLVGNAAKFTETGHILVRVRRPADADDVVLDVEDTGIGIPDDKLDHIFGVFNQVDDGRDRRFDGTGLGLSITRNLIDLMGGTVEVSSRVGRGSRFRVRLPLPCVGDPYVPPRAPAGLRAWLVGPEGAARDLLERQLGDLGADVACTGRAAWPDTAGPGDTVYVLEWPGTPPPDARLIFVQGATGGGAPHNWTADRLTLPIVRQTLFDTLTGIAPSLPVLPPDAPAAAPPVAKTGRPLRVLAAEDNKTNRLVLSRMLKDACIDLHLVVNGVEVVEAYVTDPPDLVFMDISMPLMDGREATRRIRAHEAERSDRRVPIHAMTAHALPSDVEESLRAGIDGHLTKPLCKAALIEVIENVRQTKPATEPP